MSHTFSDPDLAELDRIWPLGGQLVVPDGGRVLVAGAYKGRYMDYVLTLYKPETVIGYEPQKSAIVIAQERLSKYGDRVRLVNRGVGVHDCWVMMSGMDDGFHTSGFSGQFDTRLESPITWLSEPVNLFICNIEGFENFLLPYLILSGWIESVRSLAIQFHNDIPNRRVWDALVNHYGRPVYDDYPIWCYFVKK